MMKKVFLDISGPISAERLVNELKKHKPEGKVLDIGTGKAICLQVLRDNGYDAFGVDLRRVFEATSKPFCAVADVMNLPFADSKFNAVTESFMFAQGYEIDSRNDEFYLRSFEEVRRVLSPGGIFLSSWAGILDIPAIGRSHISRFASEVGLCPERSNDRNILVYQNRA
jgi:ubiquinone/menaquinone biosynthesis C-methylase UbiE